METAPSSGSFQTLSSSSREFRVVRAKQPDQVQWNVLCANQSRRSCDLSGASLFYLGKYLVRVRAEAGGRRSPWVKLSFHPDREGEEPSEGGVGVGVVWRPGTHPSALPAMLGPPSRVALSRDGSSVDVHIDDPVTTGNASMRTVLPHLYYHILYWEGPCLAQVPPPPSSLFLFLFSTPAGVLLPQPLSSSSHSRLSPPSSALTSPQRDQQGQPGDFTGPAGRDLVQRGGPEPEQDGPEGEQLHLSALHPDRR